MERRQFLKWAAAAIAGGMVLDPDRLLWVPGAKTYFLPDPTLVVAETMADALGAGLVARVPSGHGGWAYLDLRLAPGSNLEARLRAEVAAILAMGGRVIERRHYTAVKLS